MKPRRKLKSKQPTEKVIQQIHAGGGIFVDLVEKVQSASEKPKEEVLSSPPPTKTDRIRPDGEVPHRLEGTDRIEWITPLTAKIRNSNRTDSKRWVVDDSTPLGQVLYVPPPPAYQEWQQRLAQGIVRDNQIAAIRAAQAQKEADMSKTATAEKSEKKTTNDQGGKARAEWKGLGMCELIRYCGKKSYGKTKTLKIMKKLGLDPNPATISIQLRKGRNDENVPQLGKDVRGEFTGIADAIPNDEKPTKKAEGSAKGAKSSSKDGKKSGGKKSKKGEDVETAESADTEPSEDDDDEEAALEAARQEAEEAEEAEGDDDEDGE